MFTSFEQLPALHGGSRSGARGPRRDPSMCMDLLKQLAERRLPCTVADPAQIDTLRVLEAARLALVLIPAPHVDCDHCMRQDPATVLEITPDGWQALRTGEPEEAPLPASLKPERIARPVEPSATAPLLAPLAHWFSGIVRRSHG